MSVLLFKGQQGGLKGRALGLLCKAAPQGALPRALVAVEDVGLGRLEEAAAHQRFLGKILHVLDSGAFKSGGLARDSPCQGCKLIWRAVLARARQGL